MPNADSVMVSSVESKGNGAVIAEVGKEAVVALGSEYRSVSTIGFDPESKGVFYETQGQMGGCIWYAAKGRTGVQSALGRPAAITQGSWHHPTSIPVFRDRGRNLAAMIAGCDSELSLYLVGPTAIIRVADWEGATAIILAHNDKTLVVDTFVGGVHRLSVYEMHSPARKVL